MVETVAAGDLDKRVTLQVSSESVDAGGWGEATETWRDVQKLWASIDTGGSREFYRASQVVATMTHLVTIRYRTDVTTKHRLKYKTRVLNIGGIENPGEHNVMLRLSCTEKL